MADLQIPFGKYKGQALDDVPASYLLWLADQDWVDKFPDIKNYIERNRQGIEKQVADGQGDM